MSDEISEKFSTSESVSVVSLLDTPLCRRNKDSNLFRSTLDYHPTQKIYYGALVGMSVRMGWEVISMQTGR